MTRVLPTRALGWKDEDVISLSANDVNTMHIAAGLSSEGLDFGNTT
jgi:hypothetical protein